MVVVALSEAAWAAASGYAVAVASAGIPPVADASAAAVAVAAVADSLEDREPWRQVQASEVH